MKPLAWIVAATASALSLWACFAGELFLAGLAVVVATAAHDTTEG